jgi:copper oxidase (laccase) domain-containing protein
MTETYECTPNNIVAVIAPGISMEAFEVGNEVYNTFNESGFPMEKIARLYPTARGGSKWHIDLWEANRLQLIECGIPERNISTAGICTYREHDRFFSARRLGIESGRIFSGIMLI